MLIKIEIDVDYNDDSIGTENDVNDLIHAIEREVTRFIGNGMLTPTGEEVVDRSLVSVDRVIT